MKHAVYVSVYLHQHLFMNKVRLEVDGGKSLLRQVGDMIKDVAEEYGWERHSLSFEIFLDL